MTDSTLTPVFRRDHVGTLYLRSLATGKSLDPKTHDFEELIVSMAQELLEARRALTKLRLLEAAGIANWAFYQDALTTLDDELEFLRLLAPFPQEPTA